MPAPTIRSASLLRGFPVAALLLLAAAPLTSQAADSNPVVAPPDHAIVSGFERHFAPLGEKLSADEKTQAGRLLANELNCIACHRLDGASLLAVAPKTGPHLDQAGSRLRTAFLYRWLNNPQAVKPGTTMPDLLVSLPEKQRFEALESLVHLFASTGSITEAGVDPRAARAGEKLFHQLGCVACHAPTLPPPTLSGDRPPGEEEDEEEDPRLAGRKTKTIIPLGSLEQKYTLGSLTAFLRDPLAIRPSARMPHFNLTEQQARELASYFLRNVQVPPNLHYAYYEGDWDKLPEFDTLKPKEEGTVYGFDLELARRKNSFAMRFRGYLQLEKDAEYRFFLGSDDGSRLIIDKKTIVDVDGVHPHQEKNAAARLAAGAHEVELIYFQGGGEWTVTADIEGGGLGRQPLAGLITLVADPKAAVKKTEPSPPPPGAKSAADQLAEALFQSPVTVDPAKVERGKAYFSQLGCAACHQLNVGGQRLTSPQPLAWNRLQSDRGCLSTPAEESKSRAASKTDAVPTPVLLPVARYLLSPLQREALQRAIRTAIPANVSPEQVIDQQFTALNCYACHQRGTKGGVEQIRNAYFESTIKEIGDEGRLPPPLDGAGDKLQTGYLDQLWDQGAKERPYMLARMPKFGRQNVGALTAALSQVDQKAAAALPDPQIPVLRLKAFGRTLMGDKGFSCAKCHPFNQYVEPGVQAINLNAMARRLREDWFYRYMLAPAAYRPGTRMPNFWPEGKSTVPTVLDGNTAFQLKAQWQYLLDGDRAGVPSGLIHDAIVLKPETEPIIYRNFIEDVSPRGIAVGYPEQVNLTFDADRLALRLIWQGAFMDASKHWIGRGPGNQTPLGDNVQKLPNDLPLTFLASTNDPWPTQTASEAGARFLGYQLKTGRRPEFRYALNGFTVSDLPIPVAKQPVSELRREIAIQAAEPIAGAKGQLYFLVATGKKIEGQGSAFQVDQALQLQIQGSGGPAVVRQSRDRMELLVPLQLDPASRSTRFSITYHW